MMPSRWPARTPVNASPSPSQTPMHDSGGHRGSLLLRCRAFSSLSSRRFIPTHLTFLAEHGMPSRADAII
jgi:hypothetical protein